MAPRHRGRYPYGGPPTPPSRRRWVLLISALVMIVLIGLIFLAILGAASVAETIMGAWVGDASPSLGPVAQEGPVPGLSPPGP